MSTKYLEKLSTPTATSKQPGVSTEIGTHPCTESMCYAPRGEIRGFCRSADSHPFLNGGTMSKNSKNARKHALAREVSTAKGNKPKRPGAGQQQKRK